MEPRFRLVSLGEARATIAAHLLRGDVGAQLGEVTLATHQLAAARRVASILTAHGGALLADDVGLGKTYVALAVARPYEHVLVIAPATLRGMWRDAAARAGMQVEVTSYEALSRAPRTGGRVAAPAAATDAAPVASPSGAAIVILDEAHHARTPGSRRYPRIAAVIGRAHTLLLTATPLPNRLDDLRSLVALFAGSRATVMSEAELSALTYRRTAASVPAVVLPTIAPPRWIESGDDSACLEALQRLPAPVPPAGSGDGGALVMLGLVRQWASSRAALIGALRRSLARSLALQDSVAAGRMPTASELRAWDIAGDSVQLAFPELVAAPVASATDRPALERCLAAHVAGVTQLLVLIAHGPDPDVERARRIVQLQQLHAGEKVVCFTGFAETAAAYWHHLRGRAGVARLSARGGEIASGQLGRDAVLRRFAPDGQRTSRPAEGEEVSLLIATDLLSEGVDLRDATVVVHLDLPWSPARLEQRVGRARRMGSHAGAISVYAMRPPASSERVLAIERRLREKMAIASSAVGAGSPVLPSPSAPEAALSDAERRSALLDQVSAWLHDAREPGTQYETVGAVASAPVDGWLAAISVGGEPLIIACVAGRVGGDTALLIQACALVETRADGWAPCTGHAHDHQLLERAVAEASRHAAELAAAAALMPGAGSVGRPLSESRMQGIRERVLARIHRALATAPPNHAPRTAVLAAAARHVVSGRMSAGMELQLMEMASAPDVGGTAWLEAVGCLSDRAAGRPPSYLLRAIVVFAPTATCRA